ncbi:MAG: winged helix-turn-helix transcriptional regulator [Spirochaetales bacterium]|nr:winged helix-turn-helix transcriptional regulator [Spirochaetales bacterium]
MSKKRESKRVASPHWTFLTNHSHVLICLARDGNSVLRDVADQVGITERAVQRIVSDLEESGYIKRRKDGRRNTYRLNLSKPLRHPVEQNCTIEALVSMIK